MQPKATDKSGVWDFLDRSVLNDVTQEEGRWGMFFHGTRYCLVPILRKPNNSWMAADLPHLLSVDKIKHKYRLREWESECPIVRENCVTGSVATEQVWGYKYGTYYMIPFPDHVLTDCYGISAAKHTLLLDKCHSILHFLTLFRCCNYFFL